MNEIPDRYCSTAEIVKYLGISRDTVMRWIVSRNLPAHKVGKKWKFKVSEIDEWVKSGQADDRYTRAPFQILAIPYKITDDSVLYCVFHRSDSDEWQFIAGESKERETSVQAAKREISERNGFDADDMIELRSMCFIPADNFSYGNLYKQNNTYVVPEYAFGFECAGEITLSREHDEYAWLDYEETCERLKWDSNRTALYELNCRVEAKFGENLYAVNGVAGDYN